jgi:hypothetical protein
MLAAAKVVATMVLLTLGSIPSRLPLEVPPDRYRLPPNSSTWFLPHTE